MASHGSTAPPRVPIRNPGRNSAACRALRRITRSNSAERNSAVHQSRIGVTATTRSLSSDQGNHSGFYWSVLAGIVLAGILYATGAFAQVVGHVGDVVPLAHISYCTSLDSAEKVARLAESDMAASQKLWVEDSACDDNYLGFTILEQVSEHQVLRNGQPITMFVVRAKTEEGETLYLLTYVKIVANDNPA